MGFLKAIGITVAAVLLTGVLIALGLALSIFSTILSLVFTGIVIFVCVWIFLRLLWDEYRKDTS